MQNEKISKDLEMILLNVINGKYDRFQSYHEIFMKFGIPEIYNLKKLVREGYVKCESDDKSQLELYFFITNKGINALDI